MKRLSLLLPLLLLAAPAPAADTLPDLGDPSQEVLSPEQERQIGEQAMIELRADKSFLDDAEVNDYLNWLGDKLVANSSEPGLDFEFFALHDRNINAFAMPGGFVGVNTGLILTTRSESELASVLAHEVSHVTQHHLARMMAGEKYDSLATIAAAAIAILATRNHPNASMGTVVAAGGGAMQHHLAFSREHEKEADRIGLATLQKSGFDTYAMPVFFERLELETRILDTNAPSWLRTHPLTTDRISDIDNRVRQLPFHPVPDSLEFQLVRSKLKVLNMSPREAVTYFSDTLSGPRKFGNPVAQRYGLTLALLHGHNLTRAKQELVELLKQPDAAADPMVKTLAGQIYHAEGMSNAKLVEYYRNAVQAHPQHRALAYAYAEALIAGRQYQAALDLLDGRITGHPNDARLYELQARTYSAQGKPQLEHHALAYARISHGDLMGAIEQLVLAKQSGNDFYQLSVIENELKQFREVAAAHSGKR
ncbi:MAG TPA: M48 family metalloprotease [Gallionellaceae bacterium]